MASVLNTRARLVALVGYLIVLAAACAATALGASMLLPLIVALVPAFVVLRARLSLAATLALLLVALAWGTLALFVVARYTPIPALVLALAALAAVGAACAVRWWRRGSEITWHDALDLAFISAGGILWCGTLALAAFIPDGAPVSWAMSGDAANNILFARAMLEEGGVTLGGGQNPVPLTASFIALFTLPDATHGIPDVGSAIIGLTEMWSFGIVAACMMCGALTIELLRRRSAIGYAGVAIASALPVGWFMLSGPVLLGFVNFHLTIALLIAALVTLVHARRGVLAALVTTSLALAAVLALWAPLVGIPAVALLIIVVTHRRRVLALRGWRLVIAAVAVLQPIAFFAAVSLPSLLNQGSALQGALGAVFDFPRILLGILLAVAVAVTAVHIAVTRSPDVGWLLLAVAGGGGACLAALLWLRRGEADIWSYYQLKFLWFLLALLLILAVAAAVAVAARIEHRPALSAASLIAVLLVIAGVAETGKSTVPTFNRDAQALANPLARILVGDFFSVGEGDRVFQQVKEMLGRDEKTILWESTDPDEDSIMFWVVQMSARSVDDVDLRAYAYYHDGQSMDDLCTVRELMGAPVTVITADPEIARRAEEACADLGPVVIEQ